MARDPEFVAGKGLSFIDGKVERVWQHYRKRPWRAHFGAWMVVGLIFGFLLAPDVQLSSLAGFTISGCLCCTLLALVTYPVSDHYRLTLVGAATGMLLSPLCEWIISPGQPAVSPMLLCLIIGALVGASSMVWLAPLRFLQRPEFQTAELPAADRN